MTAPATESATSPQVAPVLTGNNDGQSVTVPEGAAPIRLPVMVVEGMETADGRFIEPGALKVRTLPIGLYSQVKSSHGSLQGDAATVLVGAITEATRRPGPEIQQLSTGQPFPEGTFVWEGTGWMYKDVPAPPDKSAYQLVADKALRGNSVDLSDVDAEFEYADGQDMAADPHPNRIVITSGFIGATTLVGQPAFPDAFIELDGEAMPLADAPEDFEVTQRNAAGQICVVEVVKASATPMWLSAETGDQCAPCTAIPGPYDALLADALGYGREEDQPFQEDLLQGADIDPDEITPRHTGGMLALVPANPNMLRVPGGDPAEELHLTLAYLGDNVTNWPPEDKSVVYLIARSLTDFDAAKALAMADAEAQGGDPQVPARAMTEGGRTPAQKGPLTGSIFSHAVFNPNGDNGFSPATVYLLDGTEDRNAIDMLADEACYRLRDALGTTQFPEQHKPYVPHVTAGYGVPVDQLTYTGPVEFSHLRVALGDEVTDFPLGGGDPALVASATILPPADWFQDPGLDGPTPLTVGQMTAAGAPVYGHLACWGTCHIGFAGKCVTPPRSASAYAYFMVHSTQALLDDDTGAQVSIPVGYGTIGTGHADVRRDALAAAEHYDNTGTVAFEYAVGEDAHGIWFAGRLLPGLSEEMEAKARGTVFSGDWRTIRGRLELVASLGVNVPGFPVPRVRVASGQPVALVAAGAVPDPMPELVPGPTRGGVVSREELREILGYIRTERDSKVIAEHVAEIDRLTESTTLGDIVWQYWLNGADLTLALDGDHPWFAETLDDPPDKEEGSDDAGWDGFARKNWVAKAGGLPKYIKRISKHLRGKGMTESQAIATAVNAAKRMCSTGDLNFPGSQQVNPGSRAEACEAVAQWNAKRKAG